MSTVTDSAGHASRTHGTVTAVGASRTPGQSRAVRRRRHRMVFYLVLGLLRDRRFREDAIVGAVVLAALAQIAREHEVHARARLVDWWNAPLDLAAR